MQLHEVKPIHKLKNKKRIGRGGKRGTYSGKGVKGQKARAGAKIRPELRDLVKKIPKIRGYKFGPVDKGSKNKKRTKENTKQTKQTKQTRVVREPSKRKGKVKKTTKKSILRKEKGKQKSKKK